MFRNTLYQFAAILFLRCLSESNFRKHCLHCMQICDGSYNLIRHCLQLTCLRGHHIQINISCVCSFIVIIAPKVHVQLLKQRFFVLQKNENENHSFSLFSYVYIFISLSLSARTGGIIRKWTAFLTITVFWDYRIVLYTGTNVADLFISRLFNP